MERSVEYRVEAKLSNHKYMTLVHDNRGHSATMDLPKNMGGHNTGTGPLEFLSEALAGCTIITFQMIAIQSGVKINDMKVLVKAKKGKQTLENAKIRVIVDSECDKETLQGILEKTEQMCPVSAIFEKAGIPRETKLTIEKREVFCE